MNKKVLIILVIFVIVIVGGYFLLNKKDILSNIIETESSKPYKKYTAIDTSLSKNTIAYIPLDDRPINLDRVKYLAESIDYNLVLPDINDYKTYLDNTGKNKYGTQFGNPQNLAKWLNNMEDEGCDYYIISLDQLFSGGLVGSRYLTDNDFESTGTDFNYVKKALERIVNDSNNHIYLFDTIMRLASTVSFYGLDLDTYNSLYAYGSISRHSIPYDLLTIENIVKNYKYDDKGNEIGTSFSYKGTKYNIKPEIIEKYIKARERKIKLSEYYFNILQGKNNVTLTVSVDDSNDVPNPIQTNESKYIEKIAAKTNRNIYIRGGIDEQGMVMLARLALDNSNIKLKVNTTFYGDRKNKNTGFTTDTYNDNYTNIQKILDISEENNNYDIDVLIYTRPDDLNRSEEETNKLLDKYIDNIKNHIPTIIITSEDERDDYLIKTLKEKVPLGYLLGFSRWGYFDNSSGVALSEGIVRYLYLRSGQKSDKCDQGYLKLMSFSYIKDLIYIPNYRNVFNKSYQDNATLTLEMNKHVPTITNNLEKSNYIADLLTYTERGIEKINPTNYYFPWNRSFEMNFEIETKTGSAKIIEIEYLGKNETIENVPIEKETIDNNSEIQTTDDELITVEPKTVDNNNTPNKDETTTNNNDDTNENINTNTNNTQNNNNNTQIPSKIKHYITHYSYISLDSNKMFDYYSYITRSELAKWLCLANNIPIESTFKRYYNDVTTSTTNWKYIIAATKYGYFEGDSNSTFKPNNYLTRAEAVTVMLRVIDKNNIRLGKNCNPKMPDVERNKWYYDAMDKASKYCIIEGDENGNFNPTDNTKKVEMVAMINRTLRRNHTGIDCNLPKTNPFKNIPTSYWGYNDLLEAAVTHTCSY